MKTANAALLAILNGIPNFLYADLWTFTLKNGDVKYYTDFSVDLTVGGHIFKSNVVGITGATYKLQRGLQVDENTISLFPIENSTEGTNGVPILQAVQQGLFDRAVVRRQRQFMPSLTAGATPDLSANAISLFIGEVTDSDVTRMSAQLKIKSMINLLNIQMPRRQYQPTCSWVFGDSNCLFSRGSLIQSGIVATGSAGNTILCGLASAAGFFNNGAVKMTSGLNSGVSRSVKSYTVGVVVLANPFPNPLVVGDAFTILPGCGKNIAGPTTAFNSTANAGSGQSTILCGLTNAGGYFVGGTILFTTGPNSGQTRTVSAWSPGSAAVSTPFPFAPAVGDAFTITASAGNTTGSCTGYSNQLHFGGHPYIPVPETSY